MYLIVSFLSLNSLNFMHSCVVWILFLILWVHIAGIDSLEIYSILSYIKTGIISKKIQYVKN